MGDNAKVNKQIMANWYFQFQESGSVFELLQRIFRLFFTFLIFCVSSKINLALGIAFSYKYGAERVKQCHWTMKYRSLTYRYVMRSIFVTH